MCKRTSRAVLHFAFATRTLGPKDFVYNTRTVTHFVDMDNTVYNLHHGVPIPTLRSTTPLRTSLDAPEFTAGFPRRAAVFAESSAVRLSEG